MFQLGQTITISPRTLMETAQKTKPKSLGNSKTSNPVLIAIILGNYPCGNAAWQLLLQVLQPHLLKTQKGKFLLP